MSVNERNRRDVYLKLEELMGDDLANKLMDLIPLQPHTELATRSDIVAMAMQLRGEMAELRSELRGEMAELRSELRGEMAELRGEMAELRGEMAELRGEMAELRGEISLVRGDLGYEIGRLYRWGMALIVANGVAVIAALAT